jgi:rare lipoprotein A
MVRQKPDVIIQIGNDQFTLGDHLISFEFKLGESRQQSYINFVIYDYNGEIANKYFVSSYKKGGLIPVAPPTEEVATSTTVSTVEGLGNGVTISNSDNGTVSRGGKFIPEVCAFLDMIASKESAPGQGLTRIGYFSNNGVGNSQGFFNETEALGGFPISAGTSYNVGRYQFRLQDYNHAREKDKSINNYLPANQDKIAYFKLGYREALPYLLRGDIPKAISKAAAEWASLPTSDNPRGVHNQVQAGTTIAGLIAYYNTRLNYYRSLSQSQGEQASQPKPTSVASQNISEEYVTKSVLNSTAQVSFYGKGFDGGKTASGEIFRTNTDFTAAHNTLAFGTLVRCTWLVNNKSVIVRINDRGGFAKLGRQLDLSTVAMRSLSDGTNDAINAGVISAKLEVVERKLSPGSSSKELAKNQAIKTVETEKNTPPQAQPEEIAYKGQQIFIEVSLDGGKSYGAASFIHQATRTSGMGKHLTSFSGVAVSWKLNRRVKSTRYSKVTLKGLATNIARQNQLELVMKEEGEFIESVAQVSLSDWKFLLQVSERQGFNVRTVGRQLYLDKITTGTTLQSYLISDVVENRILSLDIDDTAQTAANFEYQPGTVSTTVDPDSGTFLSTDKKIDGGGSASTGQQLPPMVQGKNYSNPRSQDKKKKEFLVNIKLFTEPEDIENSTPDTPILLDLRNEKYEFLSSKSWFVESVLHRFDAGVMTTDLTLYQLLESTETTVEEIGKTAGTNYTDRGIGSLAPYKIVDWKGNNVLAFEDIAPHWKGSRNYAVKKPRQGQREGAISHMRGNPKELVYDFTISQNGSVSVNVPSPVQGKVVRIEPGFGRVVIEDSSGTRTQVLHMSGLRVKEGDQVLFGSILGTQNRVDAGGASTGVHVHIQTSELILRRYIDALLSGNFGGI